ncbi:MAG: DEAD/DEAH box helicase [Candidatus Wallbacteria bacterium]|nr:DEAD/DEAH box helicase [Candidatus Wallbacteria bacterium]
MRFQDLHLSEPLLAALATQGYERPTLIQQKAIPHVLAGKDLLGCAQTGTGKTAAFALPMLQRLAVKPQAPHGRARPIRALVLTPTRELAAQIGESFHAYGRNTGLRATVIFGGVGQQPQTSALRQGPDILVATPGRLLDLMSQGYVRFDLLEIFVLDEADRMLDMGFIHDVRRVIRALPRKRQTLFFSATMPDEIRELARDILLDPVRVDITPEVTTPEKIGQTVYYVDRRDKCPLLVQVLADAAITRALVFTRTKRGADKVVRLLERAGIGSVAIHGNKSQGARERALDGFKTGRSRVLVATDIAARGLDIDEISHVINYDIPEVPETYVHRIGRTARAGADGLAMSFCDADERAYFNDIERLLRMRVPMVEDHGFAPPGRPQPAPAARGRGQGKPFGSHARRAAPPRSRAALPAAPPAAPAAPPVNPAHSTRSRGRGRIKPRVWGR